ncbi:hypothetical protein I4U23_010332 [Adineta vaga]|nr:hypothetical protein I4U23_010332 [Adineta vaga]
MLSIWFILSSVFPIHAVYQSTITFSSTGKEFQPRYSLQLLTTQTTQTVTLCSAACNQLSSCRLFDYDSFSQRCRLFEGDTTTTGSIISSSSLTSLVGTVIISSTLYSAIHSQTCQLCQQNRYETCAMNTSTCQCPLHTYWDGSLCALQLFENDTCVQRDACRSDLNLTCTQDCYGRFIKCVSILMDSATPALGLRFGITVAGACNGSSTTNQTTLVSQSDITIDGRNTIYVGDNSNQLMSFAPNNRTAQVLQTFMSWPAFLYYDNRTSRVYVTVLLLHLIYIWPTNRTIPPNGLSYSNCSMNWVYAPSGIVVDSVGNVYISSFSCNWIMKWTPNATNGTVVAGSPLGYCGSDSQSLCAPSNLALDEANSLLYVADRYNDRVQRFILNGSGIGITVAGGNGQGIAQNQLNRPTDIYLSKSKNEIYIADSANNRIQKWVINATVGTTVAGSPNGTSVGRGNHYVQRFVLNGSGKDGTVADRNTRGFANNPTDIYIADYWNNRVQK